MKRLAISLACAILVSGCTAVSGVATPIEDTVKVIQNKSNPKPTIILAHGCDGMMTRPFNYFKAKEIADWGYNVVMVDSLTKRRAWNLCSDPFEVTVTARAGDIAEATKWVEAQPWHSGKIGLIGYSHGGATALNVVGDRHFKGISAAVAYYPYCAKGYVGQDFRYGFIPLQIHSGDADGWNPVGKCHKVIHTSVDQPYDLFVYPGAPHSFDNRDQPRIFQGHYLAYDHKATTLATSRTREFFNKYVMN